MRQDPRARRREQTRRRIYEAALRLFEDKGFEHVSVSQIATAAGVSVPTFYAHFPSKDHVVMALPRPEELELALAAQPPGMPFADRIRGLLIGYLVGLGPEQRADTLVRWRIIVATPGLRYRAAEFERTTAGMLLEALGPLGSGAAAKVVVAACLSAYTEILLRWAESDGQEDLGRLAEEVLDHLRAL